MRSVQVARTEGPTGVEVVEAAEPARGDQEVLVEVQALGVSLRAGETVMVHGAAGGLGTATLQVARGYGARTIAVVSSDDSWWSGSPPAGSPRCG